MRQESAIIRTLAPLANEGTYKIHVVAEKCDPHSVEAKMRRFEKRELTLITSGVLRLCIYSWLLFGLIL